MAEAENSLVTRLRKALGSSYTIAGEIGRGGMGVVYQARDERLKRQVAVKVLPPELAFREEIRIRFLREAETAAQLSHPHIVPIHSVGEGPDGLVYFVMAYVDGESLGAKLKRRGRLPPDEARRIMLETADALGAAHSLGIIHRDVKPDNILLEGSRGRVVVTDFGIAKALSSTTGGDAHGDGCGDRHAALHEPGASGGGSRDRRAIRHLQFGRGGVPDARGRASLPGSHRSGDPDEAHHGTAAADHRSAAGGA